jgi:hypothetical protein
MGEVSCLLLGQQLIVGSAAHRWVSFLQMRDDVFGQREKLNVFALVDAVLNLLATEVVEG